MPALTIRLHPSDNVVVARLDLLPGTELPEEGVTALGPVPAGHKIATAPIAPGEPVRKYGQILGFATEAIRPGEHVHTHNLGMGDFDRDYAFGIDARPTEYVPETERATFEGIVRADGTVATRNYLGVLTTVNCSATAARFIAEQFRGGALAEFPNVDGVVALGHGTGCGMGSEGEPMDVLRRTIAGYARHPNFAGILILGLGCESNQISGLMRAEGLAEGPFLQTMTIQDTGGTARTVREGTARLKAMLPAANAVRREGVPASHLTLALQCGGSDGYSGITANPALGACVDLLVRHGGSAVLSETPEIYGAEHLLTRRAQSRAVGEKLVARIRWWEEYTAKTGGEMNNNPSPGNKAGGLTTILEKSLGAVAKGGSTNLVEVYRYAEPIAPRVLCSWTRPATTRSRQRGRSPAVPMSSASPPGAARCSAASRRRASSSPPTRRSTAAWKTIWTSIAARSPRARPRSRRWAGASSIWCWRPPRAARPRARNWASAKTSSPHGCSAR